MKQSGPIVFRVVNANDCRFVFLMFSHDLEVASHALCMHGSLECDVLR